MNFANEFDFMPDLSLITISNVGSRVIKERDGGDTY